MYKILGSWRPRVHPVPGRGRSRDLSLAVDAVPRRETRTPSADDAFMGLLKVRIRGGGAEERVVGVGRALQLNAE